MTALPGARTLTNPQALADAGLIEAERLAELAPVAARYAVALTPALAALIDPADPDDPIARQFIPDARELTLSPGETGDPIGDQAHSPVEGIVHRYPDRVLLKAVHACAVYCRFCFRREMVGPKGLGALSPQALDRAIAYIAERPVLWEVILTGGDPLILSPRRLREIMGRLAAIGHVKVVRLHTRLPVADPEAVTGELIEAIKAPGKAVYVALHANHPRELTPAARAACARLIDAGVPMVSQSVLLKGVNDDVETRIRPYYLHHGDAAPGTAHLRLTLDEGRALVRGLRGRISGLAQPTFVLDIPGGHGKVPAGPAYLSGDGRQVEDPWGAVHDLDA